MAGILLQGIPHDHWLSIPGLVHPLPDLLSPAGWSHPARDRTIHPHILTLAYYIHRHFPDEFSLRSEIVCNLMIAWILDTLRTLSQNLASYYGYTCPFLLFRTVAVVDMLRCLTFILVLYIITMKTFTYFPLPFTWVFEDFSKFIFDPLCLTVFRNYLKHSHPDHLPTLNRLMTLYVKEFDSTKASTGSVVSTGVYSLMSTASAHPVHSPHSRQLFLECLNNLDPIFAEYKHTRSAHSLKGKLIEFEHIASQSNRPF